ncbi:MAG TPA: uracil-DNA glycosylase, partial [Planctomycetota bacterium]|nr:uracil-DNA glycosylase [Planctomycetota bacterium]
VAWDTVLTALAHNGVPRPRPKPGFGHGAEVDLGPRAPRLLGAYHPSQLNTRTGRLTAPMFDAVLARAKRAIDR